MSKRELFIKNTLFNTGFKLVSQLVAIFILPLFVKNLGAELYGIWVISGIIMGYLGIMDLGFTQGTMKFISEAISQKDIVRFNKVFSTSAIFFFLVGTAVCLLILLLNERVLSLLEIDAADFDTARRLLIVSALFSPLFWTSTIIDITFQGALLFKPYSILSGLRTLGKSISMLYMVYFNYDIVTIAIVSNIIHLILWLPSIYILKKEFPSLSFTPSNIDVDIIKEMTPFSLGVFYASLVSILSLQLDNMIIGAAISMSAVTAYAVSSKLFFIGFQYMGLLSGVFQPTSYRAFAENDTATIEKLMEKGTKYMGMLYIPVGIMGIIISPMFIELWMGQNYLPYVVWSQAFMLLFIITSSFGMPMNLVFNSGRTRPPNIVKTISIIINVTLSIALVKYYGIGGPILGTLAAGIFGVFTFPYFCRLLKFKWSHYFLMVVKIIFVNLPATLCFYWLQSVLTPSLQNLVILLFAMPVVLFGTLYATMFTSDEKEDVLILLAHFRSTR